MDIEIFLSELPTVRARNVVRAAIDQENYIARIHNVPPIKTVTDFVYRVGLDRMLKVRNCGRKTHKQIGDTVHRVSLTP